MFYLFGKPYHRGFFCDDESIKYPYKDSTVSSPILYLIGIVVPVSVMLLIELHRWYTGDCAGQVPVIVFGRALPVWVVNCYTAIGVFGFGAACSQLITDLGKYSIGRLRPHFMSVCEPAIDCSLAMNKNRYIVDFECLGRNEKMNRDARLSFPSGHSSFAAYTMIYLAIYLQMRFKWKGGVLLRHILQFCCIAMAWGTALSRVSDYKHHWSDVTVGFLIGTIVAIVNATCVSDLLKTKSTKSRQDVENNTARPLNEKNDASSDI